MSEHACVFVYVSRWEGLVLVQGLGFQSTVVHRLQGGGGSGTELGGGLGVITGGDGLHIGFPKAYFLFERNSSHFRYF